MEIDGQSARTKTETVSSLQFFSQTLTELGLASSSSTSSTNGSCLFLTKRRSRGPSCINQLGRVESTMLSLFKPRKRSCGVAFAAVQSKDRTECKALGSFDSHENFGCR